MDGTVTWATLWIVMGAVGTIVGACFLVWWRIEGKVSEAKQSAYNKSDAARLKAEAAAAEAIVARRELADYKTHVAETFVTKQGQREMTDQIMSAFGDLRGDFRGIRDRIDKFIDNENKPPRR